MTYDYERACQQIEKILDKALGTNVASGAGEGIVADVALLAQRYHDLRTALNEIYGHLPYWPRRLAEIEAAELREEFRNV